jgi:hypothetical protein
LTDQMKEQYKIYAPKAFNFLCKESRHQKKRKRYGTQSVDLQITGNSINISDLDTQSHVWRCEDSMVEAIQEVENDSPSPKKQR